jgi:type II secretory pathway pseudopilin PulG
MDEVIIEDILSVGSGGTTLTKMINDVEGLCPPNGLQLTLTFHIAGLVDRRIEMGPSHRDDDRHEENDDDNLDDRESPVKRTHGFGSGVLKTGKHTPMCIYEKRGKSKPKGKKRIERAMNKDEKGTMPLRTRSPQSKKMGASAGFTLVELIIIMFVILTLATLAVPEVLSARKESRALLCGTALKQIEAAKSAWAREFPGASIPNEQALQRYFPQGSLPTDPWGIGFQDVTTLNIEASHPYNGNPAFEKRGADPDADSDGDGVEDILENGYNDLGSP